MCSSPGKVQYHGLCNQGTTCYLNSVLQVLFMTEDFRAAVERHDSENPATECIDRHLKALFDDLKERTAYTYNITRKLGIDRVREQRDAAEYYEKILSLTSPDASQIFHGWLTDKTICSACGREADADGAFWHLPLALVDSYSEHYSVVDGIKEHFRASDFSGENQMYCEQCDAKSDATIKCVMKHHPEVLMLLLKRFDFDYRYMTYVKINQTVDVPCTLQIPENQTYELYAVVDHFGDLRSGHYTATIRDDENWFNFNDASVTLADYQPFQEDNFEKSCSAYLLFYRKMNATQTTSEVSAPGGYLPATSNYDQCQDAGKKREREEGLDTDEETERVRSRGVELQPNPHYNESYQDTIPCIPQAEKHRDQVEILTGDKEGMGGNAEAENQPDERGTLCRVTQCEDSVDENQDSGKESTPDVSNDFKPEISDRLAKDAHLSKEDEISDEERGVMDVKIGEDKQSEKDGKSLTKHPEDNARENMDGNLRGTQEDGHDLKPVSEDEQRDERGVGIDDKEGKTEADVRRITSEIGNMKHDLCSREIQDYGRGGNSKQNMPKDDHQQREERMDVPEVEKQKSGDDKHAQSTDTSVTEPYPSEGVQAQDSDSGRRDDVSGRTHVHPEQKISITPTIQKDVEIDKKGSTRVDVRGTGSGPTQILKIYDLCQSNENQDDRRVDDNKQKMPKDDQRCKEGGSSRYKRHEQERGVKRDVKGVMEQKRGDSEHPQVGQDVEDQNIVGLDDRQRRSEQEENQDLGKKSTPDVSNDFKPEISGRLAKDAHLSKEDKISDEERGVMDVKIGEDKQSEKDGKSLTKHPEDNARENMDGNLRGTQEDGHDLKPVSEDEQRDERGVGIDDKEGKTEADVRRITSEIGNIKHDLCSREIQDYGRGGNSKQNMPKDDHQQREERMDVPEVEEQKSGDDKHAQSTDTSVTEPYPSEGVQAQDSDSGRRDDVSGRTHVHPEQKISITPTIQKDVELDKKGSTRVDARGTGSGPTQILKIYDLCQSNENQDDRRVDDNKQKMPKDDQRCKEGGSSRYKRHEQERGVKRDVKGVMEQKRGDSEHPQVGQDVEDQNIVGLDDRQRRSEQEENQDLGKESTPDVSNDFKPEISGRLAKDAHLSKEDEIIDEERGVMDVKIGEDKQSEKDGKSLTKYPEDNARENMDGNLRSTQEDGHDLKPVSEDEQRDERGVGIDDKEGKTEADVRGITSEIGNIKHDLCSREIQDYGRGGNSKQNMPKDDHQQREERMDVPEVEEQKSGDDKHAQSTDTSVTEPYPSEGVQAQDSDSGRRDDVSGRTHVHPEQKISITPTIQKDVELDKKGSTRVDARGTGSGPTQILKIYDLCQSNENQDDRRVDDNKQKMPKDDQRCKEGGSSRYKRHEQERGVKRDVKGVMEQKRGDSEHPQVGQDVEDQNIVGLDDRQRRSEQEENQDLGKESTPDVSNDFKPEISGRLAKDAHLSKEDEISDEERGVMDVKIGEDKQSEKDGKSLTKYPEDNARENMDGNLRGTQEDGHDLKPVSEDEQRDERGVGIDDKEGKTEADVRRITSEIGNIKHDLCSREIQDYGRGGNSKQNMPKDDHQQREERMDVPEVEKQKSGDDKHAQSTDTSVTEPYPSEGVQAQDSDSGRRDDVSGRTHVHPEQKISITPRIQKDAELDKKGSTRVDVRGTGSGPTKLLKIYDLCQSNENQDDRRVDDNKQKMPKDDQRCKEGGSSRYKRHEQERGVKRDVKGVMEQKRGDSEHPQVGQDVEDQNIVGLDDQQRRSEQKISLTCTSPKDVGAERQSKHIQNRSDSSRRRAGSGGSRKPAENQESTVKERPGSKNIEIKIIDEEIRTETVAGSSVFSNLSKRFDNLTVSETKVTKKRKLFDTEDQEKKKSRWVCLPVRRKKRREKEKKKKTTTGCFSFKRQENADSD